MSGNVIMLRRPGIPTTPQALDATATPPRAPRPSLMACAALAAIGAIRAVAWMCATACQLMATLVPGARPDDIGGDDAR